MALSGRACLLVPGLFLRCTRRWMRVRYVCWRSRPRESRVFGRWPLCVIPSRRFCSESSDNEPDKILGVTLRFSRSIGKVRAMQKYVVSKEEMEELKPLRRTRSAYLGQPEDVVYRESDVRDKAVEVYGSEEALLKAMVKAKREKLRKGVMGEQRSREKGEGLRGGTGQVVLLAVFSNAVDAVLKCVVWSFTSSHSVFAEFVHSCADTCNQLILATGVHRAAKKPTPEYPYGFANLRHVTSLISGAGIFFIGTGMNVYHGVQALIQQTPLEPFSWTVCLLGISFLTQSVTLRKAWKEIQEKAVMEKMPWWKFVWSNEDPALTVVFLEDTMSLTGVFVALSCFGLSHYLASPIPDAAGSILIGIMLGGVAWNIMRANASHLIGRSIPQKDKDSVVKALLKDEIVRSVKDVKALEMGENKFRFKAEIAVDGEALTDKYLKTLNLRQLLTEMKGLKDEEELKKFWKFHGGQIVESFGAEVDRMEKDLKKKFPDLRHVDLEVL